MNNSKDQTPVFKRIISLLEFNNMEFEQFEHEFVHHSEDAAKMRGTKLEEAAKALVLKCRSGRIIMCVVSGHRRIDLKKLKLLLSEKNIQLAHPDEVLDATGCPIGSVPPFGNLFSIPTYADSDLFFRDHLVFSAGSHYHSVRMLSNDWRNLVHPIIYDIGKDS